MGQFLVHLEPAPPGVPLGELGEGAPRWIWRFDRAVRRNAASGASATGPASRQAAESPSRRAAEPPSAQAPGKRAHLVRTYSEGYPRRTPRMRCPNTAVFAFNLLSSPAYSRLVICSGKNHPGL